MDARRSKPRLRKLEDELKQQCDIRKREQANDPQLIEAWKWTKHLTAITVRSDAAWHDYARRLALDPAATFDACEESTQ
jgi:hypothetical protein